MGSVYNGLCCTMLNEFSAFAGLSDEDLRNLCGYFECMDFAAGEVLWEEGDECGYVSFIVEGRVKVSKKMERKGNPVVMGIYGKGSFVGALCILDASPRAVRAEALEDVSLVTMTKAHFDELLEKHPELAAKILKGMLLSVSKRLRSSFDRLVTIF